MTGRCPECGHDPSSDELERRCEQLEELAQMRAHLADGLTKEIYQLMEENKRLRGALLGLYESPAIQRVLPYFNRGIGTATPTGQAIRDARLALESKLAI